MPDVIVRDGDVIKWQPKFGDAIIVAIPGKIAGTGKLTVGGKKACVEGDEADVTTGPCLYVTQQYIIPGSGEYTIKELAGDQVASKTSSEGTPVLLKGKKFKAEFTVKSPAKEPPKAPGEPPKPDTTKAYEGEGEFVCTGTKFKGT